MVLRVVGSSNVYLSYSTHTTCIKSSFGDFGHHSWCYDRGVVRLEKLEIIHCVTVVRSSRAIPHSPDASKARLEIWDTIHGVTVSQPMSRSTHTHTHFLAHEWHVQSMKAGRRWSKFVNFFARYEYRAVCRTVPRARFVVARAQKAAGYGDHFHGRKRLWELRFRLQCSCSSAWVAERTVACRRFSQLAHEHARLRGCQGRLQFVSHLKLKSRHVDAFHNALPSHTVQTWDSRRLPQLSRRFVLARREAKS